MNFAFRYFHKKLVAKMSQIFTPKEELVVRFCDFFFNFSFGIIVRNPV